MNRRRQLGLSIQQVANTVKIRPQIIEFFENEDFGSMPPRGYAQGMISSYARFLGLNPRQVVEAYLEDLHEYENAVPSAAGRFQEVSSEATSRSSNAQGRFYMVDGTASSRYGQRPPQAGYVSESTSLHQPVSANRLRSASIVNARDPQAQGRPAESAYGSQQRQGTSYGNGAYGQGQGAYGVRQAGGPYGSGSARYGSQGAGNTQRLQSTDARQQGSGRQRGQNGSGQQRDYRQQGGSGQQRDGRQQGRSGQQRSGTGSAQGRGNRVNGRSGGLLSGIDPRFLILGTALVMVLLGLLIFGIVRGCSASNSDEAAVGSTDATTIVTSSDTSTDETDASADATADDDGETSTDASSDEEASEEEAESDETIVTVSVADDAVAYLEVKLDGVSVLGSDQVGPVELEYTVEEQIVITTDSPSDVKVYVNGEKVSYDVKTSGVAKVTIDAGSTDDDDSSDDTDSSE